MKNNHAIAELADFPSVLTLPVQWGEQDAFGHVNNVIYFRWYESARIDYMNLLDVDGFDVEREKSDIGPIVASIKCDYQRQLNFPETVHIGTRVVKLGNTSMQVDHAIFSESLQAISTTSESTLVIFNYRENKPVRIPDSLRHAISVFEGREFD